MVGYIACHPGIEKPCWRRSPACLLLLSSRGSGRFQNALRHMQNAAGRIAVDRFGIDNTLAAVSRSSLIAAIEQAACDLAGMRILFMIRQDGDIVKLSPNGSDVELPGFCRLMRASGDGRRQCSTCRALVCFGACYHGLTEYCCHGGIHLVAAAAIDATSRNPCSIVVASSAFATENRAAGWAALCDHVSLGKSGMHKLRKAYFDLPVLTTGNLAAAKALVQIAAAAVGEIERGLASGGEPGAVNRAVCDGASPDLKQCLSAALFVARDEPAIGRDTGSGGTLAELVKELVARDPGMHFTVGRIAKAARMTPNHFSTLFRRHTGGTFQRFLTDRRIDYAKLLLRDLSLNIGDIARRSGFDDPGYFARRFKQTTGMTPRQWRETL